MSAIHLKAAEHLLKQGNLSVSNSLLEAGAGLFFSGFGITGMRHELSIQECVLGHPTPLYVEAIEWVPSKVSALARVSGSDFSALAQWATMGAIQVKVANDLSVAVKMKAEFAVLGSSEIKRLIDEGIEESATTSLLNASFAYREFIGRAIRFLLDERCAAGVAQMAIFDTKMFVENIAHLIADE